jgi:hypothetical protein
MLVLAMEFSRGALGAADKLLLRVSAPDGVRAAGRYLGDRHRMNLQETNRSFPQNETVRSAAHTLPGIGAGQACPHRTWAADSRRDERAPNSQ